MNRFVALFLVLVCAAAMLASCKQETAANPTPVENVTIQISDISPSGATLVITDTNPEPYLYGEWYKIQKLTDGQWQDVPHVIDNYAFTAIGYIPDENGEVKFTINWEWLYGTLPAGTYRIFKEVNQQEISIEFQI